MNVDLTLSPQHLDYIFNVLAQRPWGEANPVIVELQQQVRAQQASQQVLEQSQGELLHDHRMPKHLNGAA